jgi:hypothetical protein
MLNGKVILDTAAESAMQVADVTTLASKVEQLEGFAEDMGYKVPSAPETAGTYVLKATVAADLSVTYAWVAAE